MQFQHGDAVVYISLPSMATPFALRDGNLVDVHLVEEPHSEEVADDGVAAARDETQSAGSAKFALEKLAAPRRGERRQFELIDRVDVALLRRCDADVIHSASAAA